MKKHFNNILILASAVLLLAGCNKSKTYSNRLIKAGTWTVTELSVDGTNEEELPTWEVEDCDIYDESCYAEWQTEEGGHSEFVWQFRDKGETFEISRQGEGEEEEEHEHEHEHAAEEAAAQCYAFSGEYEVVENGKEKMEFKSTATIGYTGQTVVIKIEKQ